MGSLFQSVSVAVRIPGILTLALALLWGYSCLAQATYRYSRELPAPEQMDPGQVREARNTLQLVLYKQQADLFDYRLQNPEEFDRLIRQAAVTAADAAAIAARLKDSASLLPVEFGIREEIRKIVTPTIKTLDTGLARIKAPSNLSDLYTIFEKNNDVSRGIAKANVQLLKSLQPLAREDVRDTRLEREKALSLLNRRRLEWQTESARVKAGTSSDTAAVEKRRTEYMQQFEEVKKQTVELERITASQQNLQTAIQMHQEFEGAFQKLEAASKGLKKINLLAGDGSAMDQSEAFVSALNTISSTALGHLTNMKRLSLESLQRDKAYIHETLLSQRFSTEGGPTYLNAVLQRLPGSEADQEILDSMVSVAKKGQSLISAVNTAMPEVKTFGQMIDRAWQEHNKVNPHGDLQSTSTQNAINYFGRLSELLLAAPDFLDRRGIKVSSPIVEILKYAGNVVGTLPVLVNSYSASVEKYQQFVTLPSGWSITGQNAPFLKARHMYLHKIGLAAYSDLGGEDQTTVFVEQNKGFGRSDWVRLTPEQFDDVLRAMSIFTTLTGRNPTQDEFLTLCESRGTGEPTFRVPTFYYVDLDPDSPQFFQLREMTLSVGSLLGNDQRDVYDNPRYSDRYGGRCLELCETWNSALGNIRNPMGYKALVATQTTLLGSTVPVDRSLQLKFTKFSRRYAELNQMFRDIYSSDIPHDILGAILLHEGVTRSPLEQQLQLRHVEQMAAARYTVDVTANQSKYDQIEFLLSMSAPRDQPPRNVETTLKVTLPGGQPATRLKLSPLKGAEGRSALQGTLKVPLDVLAKGGIITYQATVAFDGVTTTDSGSLELQTLLNLSHPIAMPESEEHDTFEFSTVLYHHKGFAPSSANMKTRLEIVPLRRAATASNDERKPQQIEGSVHFDRKWGDSLAVARKLVSFRNEKQWPPGEYSCAFVFQFGDAELRTPVTSFLIPEPVEIPKADESKTDENDKTKKLRDPTGPLREAAARSASLSDQIAGYLGSAHEIVAQAKTSLAKTDEALAALKKLFENLADRIAQFQEQLPGLKQASADLKDIALQVIEAKQRATHAADRACQYADQAAAASTPEEQKKLIQLSKDEYQKAKQELDAASKALQQGLNTSTQLKSALQELQKLHADVKSVDTQFTAAAAGIEQAAAKLAEATDQLTVMRVRVDDLQLLKNTAVGLLSAGEASVAPFEDLPQAQGYVKTMRSLYGQIVARADQAIGFPDALQVILDNLSADLDAARKALDELQATGGSTSLPAADSLDNLINSVFAIDVAEVWVLRAEAEVNRALGCTHSTADAVPPDASLDGLTGTELTRITPKPDNGPDADLSGLDTNPLTQIPTTQPKPDRPRPRGQTTGQTQPQTPMQSEERTYALFIVQGTGDTQRQVPFPFQLKIKPTEEENKAVATLFIPRALGQAELAQLGQLGLSASMDLTAVWDGQKYEIRGAALNRFAKVGAVIGIGLGEAFGDSLAKAMSMGLLADDDDRQNSQQSPRIVVKDAVVYATPGGQDLNLVSHSEVTAVLPGKEAKEVTSDQKLFAKRLN